MDMAFWYGYNAYVAGMEESREIVFRGGVVLHKDLHTRLARPPDTLDTLRTCFAQSYTPKLLVLLIVSVYGDW